jgi:hypothetical protein
MKNRTYVCVYVLWERVDVRWEFYLVKTPREDLWGSSWFGIVDVTYWSRHA